MNHFRNTLAGVVTAAALSLVAACGDVEPPANDIGGASDKKTNDTPVPKAPVKTDPNRLDFGDGEATLPAKPETRVDDNRSRLDFGDDGRP
jgi:hypothetical protein